MRLLGKPRLKAIDSTDKDVCVWISAWVTELCNANWRDEESLFYAFPKAVSSDGVLYTFSVCGKDSLLIKIAVHFDRGIAVINEVVYK